MNTTRPLPNPGLSPVRAADRGTTRGSASAGSRLRPWALPGLLALVVALFLLATPHGLMISTYPDGGASWSAGPMGLWGGQAFGIPLLVGWTLDLLAVAAVLLARRASGWATLLAALPFASAALTGAVVWGWWLAALSVAVVAAVDGWRRAVLPSLSAVALAAVYVWTGIPAILPIGAVWAVSSDIPRYADYDVAVDPAIGAHLSITGLYTFWVFAAVAVAASLGTASRWRAASREAVSATRNATEAQARTAERARLAHDLHDVVAHHVSLVAVRAESAPYVHPELDDTARAVLADIAKDARQALGELRQVLAVLQRSMDGTAAAPDLAPQPGARDVVGLVDAARAAGQDVALDADPAVLDAVPAAPGYALFRAAQEALTNARRHAPGCATTLDLELTGQGRDRTAVLRVTNLVPDAAGVPDEHEPGRGLAGMRERVEALGGTLCTGTCGDDRTFVVEARIPLAAVPGGTAAGPLAEPTARTAARSAH
ncbi:hypothetical protein IF650_05495 [Cellulosimicrobium terreum]|nr:hypothetical protein [Cellulosimicrobium terreum]